MANELDSGICVKQKKDKLRRAPNLPRAVRRHSALDSGGDLPATTLVHAGQGTAQTGIQAENRVLSGSPGMHPEHRKRPDDNACKRIEIRRL
jgi:hypothetical protein